ncbi:sulfatase [candidate division KSB1 bacterium]|nr:sulfatase [candidate division KSB1 bacterium]
MESKQTRRQFLKTTALTSLAYGLACSQKTKSTKPPNFVIIFLDDSGWADFRPFGQPDYPTPNVIRLAQQGCRFNNFYVPQAVCSASRASLLSGCYPGRTKVFGAHAPRQQGLDPKFATIGEVLQKQGYTTAVFGKWHIGDQPETRPPARGFDESCGLMYSNDMWEFHPENPEYWGQWPLQFWENGQIAIERITAREQAMLTTWYTEHAVDFINRNKENPFFLYVPHSLPHVPLFCSEKFKGKSGHGLYSDVMMEIDWSVGEIVNALKSNGLDDNTMVIFSSDNGPWISYGNHAGKTPYREAKGTGFDGGTRSACIIKYPDRIKPDTVSERTFCSIDIFPTICHLAGAPLPKNEIDGKNIWELISAKPGAENPHHYYAFSTNRNFEGVISGDGHWKLHLPHQYRTLVTPGMDGQAGKYKQDHIELSLFDMKNDPYEKINVIDKYPQVASQLQEFAKQHKHKFYNDSKQD